MIDTITPKGIISFKIYTRFEDWYMRLILKFTGVDHRLKLAFLERYGTVREAWEVNNSVVSAGKAQLALLAGDASATPFTYLEVGTSSTAVNVSQTALQAAITDTGLARAAATVSRSTTNVANDTLNLAYTWTASGSKTVEEIGVFNANSAGTMLARALTTSKALTNGETLAATYKVIFA